MQTDELYSPAMDISPSLFAETMSTRGAFSTNWASLPVERAIWCAVQNRESGFVDEVKGAHTYGDHKAEKGDGNIHHQGVEEDLKYW